MNNEPRAGWLPSGSHAIITAELVDELQHTIGIFIAAEIGQPAVRAAG
jgi:hypothetical protein